MGKIKRKRKSTQNAKKGSQVDAEPEELINAPHSFVFCRGNVGETITDLMHDFRKVMEPFTASSLKARKANCVKDFLSVAGVLHVSHMAIFTANELNAYLKIAKVPRGPTLYFKVVNFSLARDVVSSLKKPIVFQKQFEHPPLVIMNNFSQDNMQLKLMSSMFQNMFPAFNLASIDLNSVRRCILFNYNAEADEIDVRHYSIKVVPVGLSKGVKKIVQSKVPDLSRFEDISEFITKASVLSESEAEDDPTSHVTLPQKVSSRGNLPAAQSSVRLVEQGPRMTLQLFKVENGFMDGEVIYHKHIVKTQEEKEEILKKRLQKRRQKEERKRIQAEMVRKKEKIKEENKKKSLEGMKKRELMAKAGVEEDEEDDDAAYYRQEVGKNPEHDLFEKKQGEKRKRSFRDVKDPKKIKRNEKQPALHMKKRTGQKREGKVSHVGAKGKFFRRKK